MAYVSKIFIRRKTHADCKSINKKTKGENYMKKIFKAITNLFTGFAVLLDESRRTNEDGSWDKYWERRNRREARRAARIARKRTKNQSWQS